MPEYAKKIYFPEHWHPFHAFFPDDEAPIEFVFGPKNDKSKRGQVFILDTLKNRLT